MKHKFKVGDKVSVAGVAGTIWKLGYATPKSRKFTICESGHEVESEDLIGYHVDLGRKIKIVKECDITKL